MSAIDVGQLDKINAIPNKNTNNVLLDGLCIEDQLYLNTLMDEESSDSDSQLAGSSSPWSPPMAERPMTLNMSGQKQRRRKMKMKSPYAITMSLEDISYIRPSWGMSKGIKRIEVRKQRGKKAGAIKCAELEKEAKGAGDGKGKRKPLVEPYHMFLALVMLLVLGLMLLSYFIDVARNRETAHRYRIEMRPSERRFSVFKQKDGVLLRDRVLRINYGRGIPSNLKHQECTCEMFEAERLKYLGQPNDGKASSSGAQGDCFACFDWARRANMRMFVNKTQYRNLMNHQHSGMLEEDLSITCYDIKWQSYDTLETPLVDCFEMNDEQWFGLGDIQTPLWPLNKLDQADFKPLTTNLLADFPGHQRRHADHSAQSAGALEFGSQVDFSLLSSNGFAIGNLKTDLQPAIKISASGREICLSAVCSDKCSQLWTRRDEEAERFRHQNNLLEYNICSASSWRLLSMRLIDERTQRLTTSRTDDKLVRAEQEAPKATNLRRLTATEVEQPLGAANNSRFTLQQPAAQEGQQQQQRPPAREAIGLIERAIFKTSPEFIPSLDGQTLRQHVDKIVKLNLKTSPILVIDTRWQNYLGSFKLNSALFPKAKLLFEILHNKGFKIVLTIKPHIDLNIGIPALKQLLDQRRLVSVQHGNELTQTRSEDMISVAPRSFHLASPVTNTFQRAAVAPQDQNLTSSVLRRKSFFVFQNESVLFKEELERSAAPGRQRAFIFDCNESYSNQCVMIDLVAPANRAWMIELIRRSSFLSQEADGLLLAGAHPDPAQWDAQHRRAMSRLVEELVEREGLFVLPQWSNNFNYVQLAPRRRDWAGLRSIVDSVLNLGLQGFSLIHPGSVWADLEWKPEKSEATGQAAAEGQPSAEQRDEELAVRWLQVAVFLPILQFNDLTPIDKYQLHEQLQQLVRIRKLHVVPEIKRHLPFTPLVHRDFGEFKAQRPAYQQRLAALRYAWNNNAPMAATNQSAGGGGAPAAQINGAVGQQFMIGADLLVAPVLQEGQRQKDIYLPAGIWHDELRKLNVRGSKWLYNYPIELNEVAWFTRARR